MKKINLKSCSNVWNRDCNGAKNIYKIAYNSIHNENRPSYLCRNSSGVFQARDSIGDGWNGATYTIRKYDGDILATGTLENGSVGDFPFTVPVYNIIDYKVALDRVIDIMTQQFKEEFPEQLKRLDRIAYTNIYNEKLYVSIDHIISNAVLWLEGNGVEITPLYTNTNLSLPDEEIIAAWTIFELNVLTIKNY